MATKKKATRVKYLTRPFASFLFLSFVLAHMLPFYFPVPSFIKFRKRGEKSVENK